MSTLKVTNIEHGSTTDGGIQLDSSGHVTIDGVQLPTAGSLSSRRLTVNGSMAIAQRGTSSTSAGYQTVDRINIGNSGGTRTRTQESLSSGSPYEEGFHKFVRVTNTSAGSNNASDYVFIRHTLEDQDIANSGWNYKSTSSYITCSFWVRSSVSQEFYAHFNQGTDAYNYAVSIGTLAADTWTKVVKTIPGNSNLSFSNDNTAGLEINIIPFWGTNFTTSGSTVDAWYTWNGASRVPDMTTTWNTSASATFDVTGLQLEVGEKATPFEHRSYGDELARCQRYYYRHAEYSSGGSVGIAAFYQSSRIFVGVHFPTTMRAQPTLDASDFTNAYRVFRNGGNEDFDGWANVQESGLSSVIIESDSTLSATGGQAGWCRLQTSPAQISFSAEL